MSGDHNMYQKPRSHVDDDIQYDEAQVQAMIKKAVRDEREACAKVCDAVQKKNEDDGAWMWEARNCAAAIRARGNT
jgi:DNA-directed RNA polymerase subunit L